MNTTHTLWQVELFGGLRLCNADRNIGRFQTQKTGAVMAYLSYHVDRQAPRELLIEMLWPDAELDAARNSLRVALNSLRKQLEPPGIPTGAVLVSDRQNVRLNSLAITTDVVLFEQGLLEESRATLQTDRIACLQRAIARYHGPLLSGYYESWITAERARLEDACVGALRRLTRLLVQVKEFDQAVDIAQRAVAVDPLSEGAHRNLIQLYAGMGRTAAAVQQYEELKRLLQEHLGAMPSPATRALTAQLGLDGQNVSPVSMVADVPVPLAPAIGVPAHQLVSVAQTVHEPVRSATSTPDWVGNISPSLTRFFGREDEIEAIVAKLRRPATRLLTLTGPGGVGKTRLSVEIGLHLREGFQGRVWFVSLADITVTDMIGSALATSLHLLRNPEREPLDLVVDILYNAPVLLIFDNLEQIEDGIETVIGMLLDRLPDLKIIATSRRPIGCEGEHEHALSFLPAPAVSASAEEMSACASVRLFLDRAQMVRPDFQITPRNAAAIAAVCIWLEGLPLAIELAAAWASILHPQQMLERLDQRFELLVSSRKDRSARHRTLRGAIEWSYNLLAPHLQRFYTQLCVFSGGWTLDAAQEVCDEPRVLELIRELHSRSILIADQSTAQPRFRMLESIREYADERLEPEVRAQLERAHTAYYVDLARRHEAGLTGSEPQVCLDALENDIDNLRATLDRLQVHGEHSDLLEMSGSLWRFWYATARVSEGRRWLQRALSTSNGDRDGDRAKALYGAGRLAACQNDTIAALALFEESQRLFGVSGNTRSVLHSLTGRTLIAWGRGDLGAIVKCLRESLDLQRATGERWHLACTLSQLSEALQLSGQMEPALALLRESVAIRERLGDHWGQCEALFSIAQISERIGGLEAAEACHQASTLRKRLDSTYQIADTCLNLGYMAEAQGDYQAARIHYAESLVIFEDAHDAAAAAFAHDNIGRVACSQQEIADARRHFEQALDIRRLHNLTG